MRGIVLGLTATCFLSGSISAQSASRAFEDNKLNFRDCGGADVTARWLGAGFSLAYPGRSPGDVQPSFKGLGWNGNCQTVRWDAEKAKFAITSAGTEAISPVVRYIAVDGGKWVATRAGNGFFVTRIAFDNEAASPKLVQETADWLARTSKEFTAGADMARYLDAGAGAQ